VPIPSTATGSCVCAMIASSIGESPG
jgi:hypothetical protein